MFLWVFGTLRTYLYHEAQLWSSCFQSPNLTNSCSLVNFLRIFELRVLGWFLVLPRCYEVWRTWPGFSSTRFPTCIPSPLFQENRESLNLRACFSICDPSFNLFQVKLCEQLQNILRKAIWTSFDRVLLLFLIGSVCSKRLVRNLCTWTRNFRGQAQNFHDLQAENRLLGVPRCFLDLFLLLLDLLGFLVLQVL